MSLNDLRASLPLLRCPVTREALVWLVADELVELNNAVADGRVYSKLGVRCQRPLEAAMRSAAAAWYYRVERGIPQLIVGEALEITRVV